MKSTMNTSSFTRLATTTALALSALGSCMTAQAQVTTPVTIKGYRYTHLARFLEEARYESSGVVIYPRQSYPAKIFDVRPHQVLSRMYPALVAGDGNNFTTTNALWGSLLQSGAALGGNGAGVRAHDLSGDFIVNVTWQQTPGKDYYFAFYEDNIPAGRYVNHAITVMSGPNKGETVAGHSRLLAVGDAQSLWLDTDGSLSMAGIVSGYLTYDSKATSFTGGPSSWAGTPLTSHLANFIGYEEGRLYFLEDRSTLHVYDRDLKLIRTDDIHLSGELRSHALGDIIDGKVAGVSYVGWDLGPVIGFFTK
jgi:hypothetical protein